MIRTLIELLGFSPIRITANHYYWNISSKISLHYHPQSNELNFFFDDTKFEKTKLRKTTIEEVSYFKNHNLLELIFEYQLNASY